MKHLLFFSYIFFFLLQSLTAQTPIVIDHTCIDLSVIPAEWINTAKDSLYIGYGHTSHGSQIISGMNALEAYYTDGKYDWSHEGGDNELHLFEGSQYTPGDLELDVGYSGWEEETRTYLDANPDCNVIIWSWCGQVNSVDLSSHYFANMEALEAEYPDVQFVYMTGHLEGLGPSGSVFTANQTIRDYCTTNNKILFDFADIEKYQPFGTTNFQEYFADDGCNYDPDGTSPVDRTNNWAHEWLNANPDHELAQIATLTGGCAHSESINCVKKGIASWYLWARLAGWDGSYATIPVSGITLSSEGGATTISTDHGTLQLYADVLPSDATNKTLTWSIQNGSGEATISLNGLVTAVADGTVTAVASATDDSGVSSDPFEINISNQSGGINSISAGEEANSVILFPNPVVSTLNVQCIMPSQLSVYSQDGRLVLTRSLQKGTNQLPLNLAKGIYYIKLQLNSGENVYDRILVE